MAYDVDTRPGTWVSARARAKQRWYRALLTPKQETRSWVVGARAEEQVGLMLNELRRERFHVLHDIAQTHEGNVDHLVSGPTGVFMIETKYRRYTDEQLVKAKRQAAKLHDVLGVWVTPVICLAERRGRPPYKHDGVWIVRRPDLLDWLRAQHNQVLEFERLARFADRL
jgi:hypothetical protein